MVEIKVILWYIFIIIVSVLGIASSGISLQCYNDNPNYFPFGNADTRTSNFMYTVINMTLLIFLFISALSGLIIGGKFE